MSQPQRNYGPDSPYGFKNKSTTTFLTLFLELCKEKRPCNVSHVQYVIYWKMRKDMLKEDPNESHDKKCARIMGNGIQRIHDTYYHYNPDVDMNDVMTEISLLTINEYISLLEAAIALPKEHCRDGSTTN